MTVDNRGPQQRAVPSIDWTSQWREHGRWLRTILHARLFDVEAVDDVFQEIALNVAAKPQRWPDPEKVGPWLYRVAVREVQLYRRRQRRNDQRLSNIRRELDFDRMAAPDPLNWLVHKEAQERVQQAIEHLKSQDREILLLKHTEQWTYRQIAERLGLTVDTVIYRLGRARMALKSNLESKCSQRSPDGEDLGTSLVSPSLNR